MTAIVIYGAGGFGREVAWLAEVCQFAEGRMHVMCFADDNEALHGQVVNGIPVIGLTQVTEALPHARVVGAINSPRQRQAAMEKATLSGFQTTTLIHPKVELSRWVEIGEGTVICADCSLTTRIAMGRHVQIRPGCMLGHDVVIGDYASLAARVQISENVHLGQRVYVGVGAVIANDSRDEPLVIGDDAVIGAGAWVTQSVASGLRVAGGAARTGWRRRPRPNPENCL